MRKCPIALLAAMVGVACAATNAAAAPVLVLGSGGRVVRHEDRFLPAAELEPSPIPGAPHAALAAGAPTAKAAGASQRTVSGELRALYRSHAISRSAYRTYNSSFNAALATERDLSGTRAYELESVITNLHDIAVAGLLRPSRLPALFLTLARNRQWWSTGSLLSSGDRVQFAGSDIVWEYYPGQGIELQVLGTFGEADGFYTGGRSYYPRLKRLLAQMIPLAVNRGGGLAWEYYFAFDGGSPPWVSAMAQGTAIEALTRGYKALGQSSYLAVAARALPLFGVAPPAGVGVSTHLGRRYVQYSFAPGASIINAFLQTLIGLYDYARASGNARAARLFKAGDAEARAELPQFVLGDWSLYQPGVVDTLSYHQLVTGFLQELCTRTDASAYCSTGKKFAADLTTPPALKLLTHSTRRGQATTVGFWVSKPAHVGIVMLRNGQIVFQTSADFGYGTNSLAVPPPGHTGPYTIRLAATDLAGNFGRISGTLQVS